MTKHLPGRGPKRKRRSRLSIKSTDSEQAFQVGSWVLAYDLAETLLRATLIAIDWNDREDPDTGCWVNNKWGRSRALLNFDGFPSEFNEWVDIPDRNKPSARDMVIIEVLDGITMKSPAPMPSSMTRKEPKRSRTDIKRAEQEREDDEATQRATDMMARAAKVALESKAAWMKYIQHEGCAASDEPARASPSRVPPQVPPHVGSKPSDLDPSTAPLPGPQSLSQRQNAATEILVIDSDDSDEAERLDAHRSPDLMDEDRSDKSPPVIILD